MAARKRRSSKSQAKPKKEPVEKPVLDFYDLVQKGIQNEPLGKAISVLNILYNELDDMEMRMNVLISRIEILKSRTNELRKGNMLSLKTLLGDVVPVKSRRSVSVSSPQSLETENPQNQLKTKWSKLKLKEETTINDVVLTAETIISLDSKAAASLIESGVAEAVESPEEDSSTKKSSE